MLIDIEPTRPLCASLAPLKSLPFSLFRGKTTWKRGQHHAAIHSLPESAVEASHKGNGNSDVQVSRRTLVTATTGIAVAHGLLPESSALAAERRQVEAIETVELGKTGLQVCAGGIGTMVNLCFASQLQSGALRPTLAQSTKHTRRASRLYRRLVMGYWGYQKGYDRSDNEEAYEEAVASRLALVDTAEVYGFGLSEEILGAAIRATGAQPFVATKFAPLPWRFSSDSVVRALRGSLERLSLPQVGLYQIHWPGFLTQGASNDAFVMGLAKCQQQGLTKAVGVSNFKAERVRRAADILKAEGVQLASNQVQYSLAYRAPETNGVMDALKETGATLIAYSPLNQGLLTGKYNSSNLPSGPRSAVINKDRLSQVEPLLDVMREISKKRGKTLAQIAINWTLCKGALPIPGAKNAKQVRESAGAFGWRLSTDEVAGLDSESSRLSSSLANPVENF